MPDSPMKAKFLKGDDKLIAIERLRMNQMGIGSGVWKWDHVKECALDPKTWLCFLAYLTQIQKHPYPSALTASPPSSSTCPSGAVQMVATLGGAWLSDRIKTLKWAFLYDCIC
ncbi:hypothetical protein SODALDRAFT_354098 [Sodiomyces alkalinus F11]|uniref:Uncharacterized protein n=1 Tax=Sodiomyces alkalinus (strain CBS 110278 / VKM F-3762 / F11) TaxID=1314773 RepID=A0A3N2Q5D3_SODAK|nr:hypothetical protein SODALDRAFT_354098 [Sodiomyces alkalinus F11]ROT41980.1 hypothetical protein SODALDRAFT_354098 [Sodiomyces alkalinus F11]